MPIKFSALSTMAAGTLAQATDFLVVVDTSAGDTLKITPTSLLTDRTFTGTLTWAGSTGANAIAVPDNLANAFEIKEGSNSYVRCVTTNGSESLTVSQRQIIASGSATSLVVGPNGATNPVFQVDSSTGSAATGVKVTGAAAGGGVAVAVVSSGTNEALTIDAKGSGTITLGGTSTGNVLSSRPIVVTSSSATAVAVGRQGTTAPAFVVDASAASSATGISVTAAAAASGVNLAAISSGTNENLTINAKGSGTITLGSASTGGITLNRATTAASSVLSTSATAGIGYGTGAGAAVTQTTNRTTGVTINAVSGAITLVSAAGSATPASFTVTNSAVAATDTILLSQRSGTDLYNLYVTAVSAGSFRVTFNTTGGTTTEQPVINFTVIKGVAS